MWRRPVVAILMFIIAAIVPLPMMAQQRPFTREQVASMVRDGFGDESGAKLIEQRGIDFAPSEDFIQTLKTAGASEAFLAALRAAVAPGFSPAHAALKGGATTADTPASAKKPLNEVQVFALLAGGVPSHRVSMLVQERGIDFEPTDDYLQEVRLAGGEDELISALKTAKVTKPATVEPAVQARKAQVEQHVAHGAALAKKGQYAEAEREYRAALLLDSQNADIYVSLSYVLNMQRKWDDAEYAAREAVNLNPSNDAAHSNLAFALGFKGDMDGDIAEYREALRLNPNNAAAHEGLGVALGSKGDRDGAIAECRSAYVLDPGEPLVRQAYARALTNSWPSLIISGEGSLPTSWSETWRFYVYHCSPYEGMCWEGTDAPADACHGVLEVGNGRIKHSCIHKKYSFDAALSDVREAKIFNNQLVITLRDGKKTRTVEFVAADRLGHTACPSLSPGARPPSDALLDAILQAMGK